MTMGAIGDARLLDSSLETNNSDSDDDASAGKAKPALSWRTNEVAKSPSAVTSAKAGGKAKASAYRSSEEDSDSGEEFVSGFATDGSDTDSDTSHAF